MSSSHAALSELLAIAGLPQSASEDCEISDCDPVLNARYKVGELAAATLAGVGSAAVEIWALRSGRRQRVAVSTREAAYSLRGNRYFQVEGKTLRTTGALHGFYRVRDGRWIFLHCNLPDLRDRILSVLRVPAGRGAVASACARWDGAALEEAIAVAGGCAGLVRTAGEWGRTAHATAAASLPVLELIRIGDAPPQPLAPAARPLSGVRVLDLTRIIAGPVCGRTLAALGADVLKVDRPGMANYGLYDLDMALGKLSAYLDLRNVEQADRLRELTAEADVFLQGYHPGTLAARGFSVEELCRVRPGVIFVTLSAWGHRGPWAGRRGFDSVVQAATGMTHQAEDGSAPELLPGSVMDYITGYLLAFGTMAALARRAAEGGSWMVRASLVGTGSWITRHGVVDPARLVGISRDPPPAELADFMAELDAPDGRIRFFKPALHLSETPPFWQRPPVPLGTHAAEWPKQPGREQHRAMP